MPYHVYINYHATCFKDQPILPLQRMSPEHLAKLMLPREFIRRYVFHPNRCATSCKFKKTKNKKKTSPTGSHAWGELLCSCSGDTIISSPLKPRTASRAGGVSTHNREQLVAGAAEGLAQDHFSTKRNKETKKNIFRLEFSSNVGPQTNTRPQRQCLSALNRIYYSVYWLGRSERGLSGAGSADQISKANTWHKAW